MEQQFHRGDLVRIAAELGPSMSHFQSGCEAVVVGSYEEQYGGSGRNGPMYTLYIKGSGRVSWYFQCQLTLVAHDREDLMAQWEAERLETYRIKSDLDWIFGHPDEVLASFGPWIDGLAQCLGLASNDLWGSRGEGFTFFNNANALLLQAEPFLKRGDQAGWLEFCNERMEIAKSPPRFG